ncbi:Baseplate J-like protein [compost metagenome]
MELPIDYVTKDYQGFYQMMKDNIPILMPEWTNLDETDPGIVILINLSYGLHILSYYNDKATAENLLPLARTRKAIYAIAEMLGYKPYGQSAAKVDITFTKSEDLLDIPVEIPRGTMISTDPSLGDEIIFETDEAAIIAAGQTTLTIKATQGITSPDEELGNGDATPNQTFLLAYENVLDNSIVFKTEENGVIYLWQHVDSFIDSLPTDRHFVTTLTDDGKTQIQVGNGVSGMKAPYGCLVTADYRYGGGAIGNVGAQKITILRDDRVTGIDSVVNLMPATGGSDAESLEHIKVSAPKAYRTQNRAVTPKDFEDLAELSPAVSKAKCVETFNETSDVLLYLASTTGQPLSAGTKSEIQARIEEVMIMNQNLVIRDPEYIKFNVVANVYIADGVVGDVAKGRIIEALSAEFDPGKAGFGDDVYVSRMSSVIFRSTEGIVNVAMDPSVQDVVCSETQIPAMENIDIRIVGGV